MGYVDQHAISRVKQVGHRVAAYGDDLEAFLADARNRLQDIDVFRLELLVRPHGPGGGRIRLLPDGHVGVEVFEVTRIGEAFVRVCREVGEHPARKERQDLALGIGDRLMSDARNESAEWHSELVGDVEQREKRGIHRLANLASLAAGEPAVLRRVAEDVGERAGDLDARRVRDLMLSHEAIKHVRQGA